MITNMFNYMVMMVNVIFAGHFAEDASQKLAAIGLGTMTLGMFARFPLIGMNCAQETLVSQAFGQQQLRLCGIYLNRGRAIMTVIYIPLIIILSFSKQILVYIGQDQTVAEYAQSYITPMILGMYFYAHFDLTRRFLMCM